MMTISVCTCTCTHIHTYLCTRAHARTHAPTNAHNHTPTHTHTYTRMHTGGKVVYCGAGGEACVHYLQASGLPGTSKDLRDGREAEWVVDVVTGAGGWGVGVWWAQVGQVWAHNQITRMHITHTHHTHITHTPQLHTYHTHTQASHTLTRIHTTHANIPTKHTQASRACAMSLQTRGLRARWRLSRRQRRSASCQPAWSRRPRWVGGLHGRACGFVCMEGIMRAERRCLWLCACVQRPPPIHM